MNKFLIKFSVGNNLGFVKDFNSKEEAEIFRKSFSEDLYRIREIIIRNRLNKLSLFAEEVIDKTYGSFSGSVDTIFRNTKNNIEEIIKFNIKYDLNIDIEDIKVYNSSNIVLIEE